jgi:hypothetical protein
MAAIRSIQALVIASRLTGKADAALEPGAVVQRAA